MNLVRQTSNPKLAYSTLRRHSYGASATEAGLAAKAGQTSNFWCLMFDISLIVGVYLPAIASAKAGCLDFTSERGAS